MVEPLGEHELLESLAGAREVRHGLLHLEGMPAVPLQLGDADTPIWGLTTSVP